MPRNSKTSVAESPTASEQAPAAAGGASPPTPATVAALSPQSMQTRSRSRQPQPASPGPVSQLGAQLRQLTVAEGTAVSWCVALKPPQSTRVLVVDCNDASASWQEADADQWLQSRLLNQVGGGCCAGGLNNLAPLGPQCRRSFITASHL